MSASDAAPLPRAGEVFFDVRGESRTMRVSWYGDTGVAVFSIWNGGTCTGTFRLPIPELPRMIDALSNGPAGASPVPPAGQTAQQGPPGAADPGPPTAAMQLPGPVPGGQNYQDGPGYRDVPGHPDAPAGYPDDQRVFQERAGHRRPAAGYEDDYDDFPEEYAPEYADAGSEYAYGPRRYASTRHGYDEPRGGEYEPMASDYEAPGGGYRDAEPGAGYPPAGGGAGRPAYQAPADPRQERAAAGYSDWAQLPQERLGQRAPSGPLPVGQWQHDQQRAGQHADDHGPSTYADDHRPTSYAGDGPPTYADDHRPTSYAGDGPPTYADDHRPTSYAGDGPPTYADDHGPSTYAGDHGAGHGYAAEAEPPYPGPGIDELGADPLEADYGGEAEQGYLPGPPTETFSPVAVGGSHSRRSGQPARDPASESLAHQPGRAGRREREYRPSRGSY